MGARPYRHSTWTCGNWPKATDPGNRSAERRNYAQQVPEENEGKKRRARHRNQTKHENEENGTDETRGNTQTKHKSEENKPTKTRQNSESRNAETQRTKNDDKQTRKATRRKHNQTQRNGNENNPKQTERHDTNKTKTTNPKTDKQNQHTRGGPMTPRDAALNERNEGTEGRRSNDPRHTSGNKHHASRSTNKQRKEESATHDMSCGELPKE